MGGCQFALACKWLGGGSVGVSVGEFEGAWVIREITVFIVLAGTPIEGVVFPFPSTFLS